MREIDKDKFIEEEVNPVAVKRLERSLIMDQVAKLEKIEVSEENLTSAFQQTLYEVQSDEQFQKLAKNKKQSQYLMESLAQESANRAMISNTLEILKKIATGELTEVPAEKPASKKKTTPKKSSKKVDKEVETEPIISESDEAGSQE